MALIRWSSALPDGTVLIASRDELHRINADDSVDLFISRGLTSPRDLIVRDDGSIWIADGQRGIAKIENGQLSVFEGSLLGARGLATDASDNLYTVSNRTGNLEKIAPDGTVTTVASGLDGAEDLVREASGDFLVSSSLLDQIIRVTPAGQHSIAFDWVVNDPRDGDYDSAGNLYFVDSDRMLKVMRPDGSLERLAPINNAADIVVADDNRIGVMTSLNLSVYDAVGSQLSSISLPGFSQSITANENGDFIGTY